MNLFNKVCDRYLEGIIAEGKTGKYATVSGWLKIKNPTYTQMDRKHELFESFKAKQTTKVLPRFRRNRPFEQPRSEIAPG